VKAAVPEQRAAIYRDPAFRKRLRENFQTRSRASCSTATGRRSSRTACRSRSSRPKDPLDYVFDLPLDTQLVAKLFQNDDGAWRRC
jgi:hypothetical protein